MESGKATITHKTCTQCKENLPVEKFNFEVKKREIRRSKCKECLKENRQIKAQTFREKYDKEGDGSSQKETQKCNICQEVKILNDEFAKNNQNANGYKKYCKKCASKSAQKLRNTLDGRMKALFNTAKDSALKRGQTSNNAERCLFEITKDDLIELWHRQEGKCFYSHLPMFYNSREWQVSLERIDESKGYVQNNVVLCCLEFNTACQWSHYKILDIMERLQNREKYIIDPDAVQKKEHDIFYHINILFSNCKKRTQDFIRKNKKNEQENPNNPSYQRKKEREHFDLTIEFLTELYKNQEGCCAYSGIPLQSGTRKENVWVLSIERKNTFIGYTKDNVCLICAEFNCTDNSVKFNERNDEICGWNKEKFEKFYKMITSDEYKEYISKLNLDLQKKIITIDDKIMNVQGHMVKCVTCPKTYDKNAKGKYSDKCLECRNKNGPLYQKVMKYRLKIDKVCNKCNVEKNITEFSLHCSGVDGRESVCKACKHKSYIKLVSTSRDSKLKSLLNNARSEVVKYIKKKNQSNQINNENIQQKDNDESEKSDTNEENTDENELDAVDIQTFQNAQNSENGCNDEKAVFALNLDILNHKWDIDQEGKCKIDKDEALTLEGDNRVSLKRIDLNKGFTAENCVLVCFKNKDMNINGNNVDTSTIWRNCRECNESKELKDFPKCKSNASLNHGHICQKCKSGKSRKRCASSKDAKFQYLINNVKSEVSKNIKKPENNFTSTDISIPALHELWDRQKGLCADSGTKQLTLDGVDCVSLKRLNNKEGYFMNNFKLVCKGK